MLEVCSSTAHYKATTLIAQDSRSATYLCQKTGDTMVKYQMKITPKIGKAGEQYEESAVTECRVLKNLDHPNIIKYHDHIVTQDRVILITVFFSQCTINKALQNYGPIPEDRAQKIASQLISVGSYLHENLGIAYSSFNANSILIRKSDDLIQLCDFSNARPITDVIPKQLFQTPPPEIILNARPYTALTEVFSIGVLVYFCMTLVFPWFSQCDSDLLKEMQRPLVKRSDMSQECFDFLKGCLDPSTSTRLSTATAAASVWIQEASQADGKLTSRSLTDSKSVMQNGTGTKRRSMVYSNVAPVAVGAKRPGKAAGPPKMEKPSGKSSLGVPICKSHLPALKNTRGFMSCVQK